MNALVFGEAPRSRSGRSSRTSRRPPRCCPIAKARWRPAGVRETYLAQRLRSGWRSSSPWSVTRADSGTDYADQPAPVRHVRAAARMTALGTTRCWGRTSSRARTTEFGLRCAAGGLDPDRDRRRRRVGRASWPTAAAVAVAGAARLGAPSRSPVTTAASSVASTARPAIPMRFAAKLREVLAAA